MFLEYKARIAGIEVIWVPSAYTAQTCHQCNPLPPKHGEFYRRGKSFQCGYCGWKGEADLKGAHNIAKWGAAVNRPGGLRLLSCNLQDRVLRLLKASYLSRSDDQ